MQERNFTNEILDDVRCYELVLDRSIKQFPQHFWDKTYSLKSAKEITKYLIEDKLKYKLDEIPKKVNKKTFEDNKLGGMLVTLFKNRVFDAIENAYPNKFKRFQFTVSGNYWTEENIKEAVNWVIMEKLDNDLENLPKRISTELLVNCGLGSVVSKYSIQELIDLVLPKKYKYWEFQQVPNGFWNNENNVKEAVKWVVEDKLENSDNRVYNEFTVTYLRSLGLYTLVKRYPIYRLLELTYPKRFKNENFVNADIVKDMRTICLRSGGAYWNEETIKSKLSEICEKEFMGDYKLMYNKVSTPVLVKNGLHINSDRKIEYVKKLIQSLINEINRNSDFPNKNMESTINYGLSIYKKILNKELSRFPSNFWDMEYHKECADAIVKYALENVIGLKKGDSPKNINREVFSKYGLREVIKVIYNGSCMDAIMSVYPNVYHEWDFNVPNGYWDNENNVIKAVKFIVDDVLDGKKENIKTSFTSKLFIDNNLGVLGTGHVLYDLLNMAYPNKYHPWDLPKLPEGFADDVNNIKSAVRWVVEENLDNSDRRVYLEFTSNLLKELNLRGITRKYTLFELLNITYPNRFVQEMVEMNYKLKPKNVDKYLNKPNTQSMSVF